MGQNRLDRIGRDLQELLGGSFSPLELLSRRRLVEKLIELSLQGVPNGPSTLTAGLKKLADSLDGLDTSDIRVVVFGGGTGLSTIIGGDSRSPSWCDDPFQGLKMAFPQTKAIVCTTDDGGSTGEMLKDFPLIGLGDIRHVMLSSIRPDLLLQRFGLDRKAAHIVAGQLYSIFNFRFHSSTITLDSLLAENELSFDLLPPAIFQRLLGLLTIVFEDPAFAHALKRPHCLGNLIISSAIYSFHDIADEVVGPQAICEGLRLVEEMIGAGPDAVLPCSTTPSLLKVRYSNGVVVTGEDKLGSARRGFPVDQVYVDFATSDPVLLPEVANSIALADIIIFAPGSLYTSIVPVMQVPGICDAIRENRTAIKVLVANLWVQAGETDLAIEDPGRRFYVSDLIKAYHRNIAGGIVELFKQVVLLSLDDIPGAILQNYAVEGKTPIYLDRGRVWGMGLSPIEANIYSREELLRRKVKHDPASVTKAVQVLVAARDFLDEDLTDTPALPDSFDIKRSARIDLPCDRYRKIVAALAERGITESDPIVSIIWRHWDIPLEHLGFMRGVIYIDSHLWRRCQIWDNLYSFYDPDDGFIKIRADLPGSQRFELAFLVALGQSVLGDYVLKKSILPLVDNGEDLGKVYHLYLRPQSQRRCWFNDCELQQYMTLARMRQAKGNPSYYTRVLNADEGFTPPGLLFGLSYAWYLDNRLAAHIEYKMAIARAEVSDLVPEQVRTRARRNEMTRFFRKVVFRQNGLS